ncbi:hypothetical protein VTG60DRAFT_1846 [Thermothelomyces hinnuleus]
MVQSSELPAGLARSNPPSESTVSSSNTVLPSPASSSRVSDPSITTELPAPSMRWLILATSRCGERAQHRVSEAGDGHKGYDQVDGGQIPEADNLAFRGREAGDHVSPGCLVRHPPYLLGRELLHIGEVAREPKVAACDVLAVTDVLLQRAGLESGSHDIARFNRHVERVGRR